MRKPHTSRALRATPAATPAASTSTIKPPRLTCGALELFAGDSVSLALATMPTSSNLRASCVFFLLQMYNEWSIGERVQIQAHSPGLGIYDECDRIHHASGFAGFPTFVADARTDDAQLRISFTAAGGRAGLFAGGEPVSGSPQSRKLEDGSYEVTFRYRPSAGTKSVYLAGDFNEWKPSELKMEGPDSSGGFELKKTLAAGHHEYKYVLEGKTWRHDPGNRVQAGMYHNSVIELAAAKKP